MVETTNLDLGTDSIVQFDMSFACDNPATGGTIVWLETSADNGANWGSIVPLCDPAQSTCAEYVRGWIMMCTWTEDVYVGGIPSLFCARCIDIESLSLSNARTHTYTCTDTHIRANMQVPVDGSDAFAVSQHARLRIVRLPCGLHPCHSPHPGPTRRSALPLACKRQRRYVWRYVSVCPSNNHGMWTGMWPAVFECVCVCVCVCVCTMKRGAALWVSAIPFLRVKAQSMVNSALLPRVQLTAPCTGEPLLHHCFAS